MERFELSTSSLPRKRSTPELHWRSLSGRRGSNPRPLAWKANALPTELLPLFRFFSAITSSDFTLSLLTTSRLLRHSSFVFLVLPKNKLQNSSFLKGVFFVELLSSVGHYREVTPSFFVRSPQIRSSINSGFFFSNETVVRFRLKLWEKMDSNHRRYKPADLQSAPFGHSGILPFSFLLSVFFVGLHIVGQSFTPVNSFPPRSSASNPIQNKLQKSFC